MEYKIRNRVILWRTSTFTNIVLFCAGSHRFEILTFKIFYLENLSRSLIIISATVPFEAVYNLRTANREPANRK